MKNYLLTLIFCTFIFPAMAINPPAKGIYYISNEGKFSIVFPVQYQIETDENEGPKTVKISATNNDQMYFCSYTLHTEYLSDEEELARVSVDAMSESLGATVMEQSEWTINKKSGLEAMLNMPEQDIKVQYYVVIFDQVQLQVIVLAKNSSFDQKAADAFIKSLKLDK